VKLIKSYIKLVDTVNEKIGYLVSWLTTAMVLVVCYDVFTRYVLKSSSVAVQEIEWHLFAIIFLVGAAYTLKHEKHVRVDVFYMKLSEKGRAVINLLGGIIFLIPFALLVIWTSKDFVINSFMIKESSPDPGGLHARYLLKACIPLSFVLILIQAFSLTFKSFFIMCGKKTDKDEAGDV
jgi:TRAP-type mannitol/chloroaromatic compound transport system permease small subunit